MENIFKKVVILSMLLVANFGHATCNPGISFSKPVSIYYDHANGTVTDVETNLMWQKCSYGQVYENGGCSGVASVYNWKSALDTAQIANAGAGTLGYADWRLPSIAELRSITEKACESPSINIGIFPSTALGKYWSSSPYADNNEFAWMVFFYDGGEGSSSKEDQYYVRLVRSGR